MALHPKTLANVSHKINAIEAGTFDETHIEALLIQIREHVSSKSWTKDLGDFIAHPERDRGLFHDELNRRALALKLQLPGHAAYKIDLGNMSEDVFFMLETAVSRINNKHWLAKLGLNQKDIKRLLAEVYVFDKLTKSHVFKKSLTYAQVKRTELVVHEALTPIQFQYLTSIEAIVTNLEQEISKLLKTHKISYNKAIQKRANEVGLCILSLLQGMSLRLFDGSSGYLCVDSYGFSENGDADFNAIDAVLRLNCAIPLMDSPPLKVPLPIISLFIDSGLTSSLFVDPFLVERLSGHDMGFVMLTKRDATGALKLTEHI